VLNLPAAASQKYMVKFFDDGEQLLFEITQLREPWLLVDKVNFGHAGWFFFELYENGQLLEKHKFYIPKDGKAAQLGEQGRKNK
jgi:hypothetical protein